jgi:hypothetical protein
VTDLVAGTLGLVPAAAKGHTLIAAIDLSVFTIGLPELGMHLSQLGDPRGINVLVNIARDTKILPYVRVQAASYWPNVVTGSAKLLGAILIQRPALDEVFQLPLPPHRPKPPESPRTSGNHDS